MNAKNLSVCLLTYNHEHLIEKVIYSILNQTYKDYELIISDDNSSDNTYRICSALSVKDERIKLIKTKSNLGMAGNANYAIRHAKYKYIALLHHDDILHEDAFSEWLNCIEINDRIVFVFNYYKTNAPKTKKEISIIKNFTSVIEGKYFLKKFLLKNWGCPVRGTALIRKKYFDEVGGMNEKFGMLADVDLWMRLSARWDVGYVNKPLMEVLVNRPLDYPKDYTEFSWKSLFNLFDIHASNINRNNYPNYLRYIFKRFVFRNKVSFEIIKWNIYAVVRNKKEIIYSYKNENNCQYFYSKWLVAIVKLLFT